jgi:AcrR family transcriptional regulator
MPAPRPPQQPRALRTRNEILAGARRVFAELGYDGATVDDVAEAAGCSKGAYYFHFASKEEVLLALVDAWAGERSRQLQEAAPEDLLETLLVPETSGGWGPRLLLEFWQQAGRSRRLQQKLGSIERSWRKLLEARLPGGGRSANGITPAIIAQLALAMHHGLVVEGCLGQISRARAKACANALERQMAGSRSLKRAG